MAIIKCPECGNTVSTQAESCPKCGYPIARREVGAIRAHEGKTQTIEQTRKGRKHRLWVALLVVGALIAVPFTPEFALWFGIILLGLCMGAFVKAAADLVSLSDRMDSASGVGRAVGRMLTVLPTVQDFSRRLLRLDPSEKWRSGLRFALYGLTALVLIVAGWTGAAYKAEQEGTAAKHAADEAEQRRLANEANAKVEALVFDATNALKVGDIDAAKEKVRAALAIRYANDFAKPRKLAQQIGNATDPSRIRAALMELTDEAFQQLRQSGTLPPQMTSGYEALDLRTAELARPEVEQVAQARENRRLAQLEAERKREEDARLTAEAAARKADAERQLKAAAEAEAARKAEEEYNAGGLILLLKTVAGRRGEFGAEITGTVINRRNRKLRYAQITFSLYDESGAQVGTALANINGLEPDGRWKFKATAFGTDFARYKFSELSGF